MLILPSLESGLTGLRFKGSNTQEHSHGDQKNKEGETENRLNTEHEPVKAWDIEDMKGPNLMDKIKFWFKSPTKRRRNHPKRNNNPEKGF